MPGGNDLPKMHVFHVFQSVWSPYIFLHFPLFVLPLESCDMISYIYNIWYNMIYILYMTSSVQWPRPGSGGRVEAAQLLRHVQDGRHRQQAGETRTGDEDSHQRGLQDTPRHCGGVQMRLPRNSGAWSKWEMWAPARQLIIMMFRQERRWTRFGWSDLIILSLLTVNFLRWWPARHWRYISILWTEQSTELLWSV